MERGQEGNGGQSLALWESGQYVAFGALNDLLRRISCRDRVPPSGVTGRILASTWLDDLVSNSLNLGQASFDIEAQRLFPYGMYEEEGAHRLDASMNHSSS